jgi:hypothetical protein
MYSRSLLIWECNHQKHSKWKCSKIISLLFIYLNISVLNTRFSETYATLLNSFISYHTLYAEMSFFDHCGLLGLRHQNSGNIVNPEEVMSQTFCVNNILLNMFHKELLMLSQ